MKRKIASLALALFVSGTAGIFAFGIGLQANANSGNVFAPGVAVTFKLDQVPLVFAGNYYAGDTLSFALTGDWWVMNEPIVRIGRTSLDYFWGLGFFSNVAFPKDDFQFACGMRVPLGLNILVARAIEPYIQVVPSFGLHFIPSIGAENFFFPVSAGFRIWFNRH